MLLAAWLGLTALLPPVAGRGDAPSSGPTVAEHGPRDRNRLALTFDACTTRDPHPYDPRVAAVLAAMRVPATIFVSGGWARGFELVTVSELLRSGPGPGDAVAAPARPPHRGPARRPGAREPERS